MRLGIIARADNRGLGQQTWEAVRHLDPAKVMVVNIPSAKPLPLRPNRFPSAVTINGWPTPEAYKAWMRDLDAVYTAETPYHRSLFTLGEQLGVRTVLHVNPEFCDKLQDPRCPDPSLYAAPTRWMWDQLPEPKQHLPVPIATDRLTPRKADRATGFLHVVGRSAVHDRNGTADLLRALRNVKSTVTVTIRCQEPGYVETILRSKNIFMPGNVKLVIDACDLENYWELYDLDQHVLVQPRRWGGLALPMQEATACGMPVISTAVSPQTDWLPSPWLVSATPAAPFMSKTEICTHTVDSAALTAKIDEMAGDQVWYRESVDQALDIADKLSWDALKPAYEKALAP